MKPLLSFALSLLAMVCFAQAPAGYYSTTSGLTGEPLKAALNDIISGHTTFPYSSTSTDVWDILKETDRDPNNPNNVIGIYSGFSIPAAPEYANGDGWNREHVWAKSRGDFGTLEGPGTDIHHLRAADVSTNSARNNRALAECSEPYVDQSGTYSGPTGSFTSLTEYVWKPRAEVRGDVARMIFYMATRYEGENGEVDLELTEQILPNTDKTPVHGRLSDLLAWHIEDPVDQMELDRNDIIFGYQGNRNPFIDHPEFVEMIWGTATPAGPTFSSSPVTTATENAAYTYNVSATGGSASLSFTATQQPSWLTFTDNGNGTATLTGTPSASDVGSHGVSIDVTDGTDSNTQAFTITVSAAGGSGGGGNATDLLFSEYIEGSSYNKALEIANFTGADVDLSIYQLKKQTNGAGAWSTGLSLSGTLTNGDVFVIAHTSANATILAQSDLTSGGSEMSFNGNDALGLFKNGTLIDIIGVLDNPANFAIDVTLVRDASVNAPNATYTVSEWNSYSTDTFSFLGSHEMTVSNPNVAPSVSIDSPADQSTYNTGDNVTIAATASDSDGMVTQVEFFVNGSSIGVDATAPYSASFSIVEGFSTIEAIATDDQGATTSATISVSATTPNTAPTVSIVSPANGATYTDGDAVTVAASASDSDGTIASVTFYVDGIAVGVDAISPYETTFTIGVGTYSIYAVATDNGGATGTSATISITGESVVTPPVSANLYLSEYIEGSSFNKALEIANTSGAVVDMTGYVVKKQTNGAGSWSTGLALSGTLADGEVFVIANTSATQEILDQADIITGVNEMTFNGNDAIGLFKDDVLVDMLGVFNDATNFAVDVTLRRNDIINLPNATYTTSEWTTFTTDTFSGLGVRYGERTVPNVAPSISLTSPTDAAVYTENDIVTISATASDSDGSVTQVEFFVNGSSVGIDATSPYSMDWTIGVGTYAIHAVATDDAVATTVSTTATITGEQIVVPSEVVLTYDDFESGWGSYTDGGADASLYSGGTFAFAGVGAADIQDNSGTASSFYHTNGLDVSGFNQVKVEFYFYPRSMENNEDFWLRYYDGATWNTVASWASGSDFLNDNFYVATVYIDASSYNFPIDAKLSFQCDASGNADDVYIDEITVTGITGGTGARTTQSIEWARAGEISEEVIESNLTVFPNPFVSEVELSISLQDKTELDVAVLDMNGKVVMQSKIEGMAGHSTIKLPMDQLENGIYVLQVRGGDIAITQKIIKQ